MVYAVIKTPDEAFREDDNAKQSIQTLRISSRTVSEMGFKNLIPRTGEYKVFPPGHFTKDLTKDLARYVRFSSASYGQSFMRLLGIGLFDVPFSTTAVHHSEHHTFAHHARAHHGISRRARSIIRKNSRVLHTIKTAMDGMGPEYDHSFGRVGGETKKRLFVQLATRVSCMYRQDDDLLTLEKTRRGQI
ncbi:hypothetical protein LXG23DRAFT_55150 [Yarrowia lipolytica]|nr:hypothetical protein LXG23DRAFT_55150 [Yarrowia lipolytica]RMI94707.1 hypothetical protein BD777DRAFT_138066 [Yarrowia lipolytica]